MAGAAINFSGNGTRHPRQRQAPRKNLHIDRNTLTPSPIPAQPIARRTAPRSERECASGGRISVAATGYDAIVIGGGPTGLLGGAPPPKGGGEGPPPPGA